MTTNKNQAPINQIDKANTILLGLRPNITALDRDAAVKELEVSEPTVNRYLLGQAKKIDIALKLIEFFRERISDREKTLKRVA